MSIVIEALAKEVEARWPGRVKLLPSDPCDLAFSIECQAAVLPAICNWLFYSHGLSFGGMVVEERNGWELRYLFYAARRGWAQVLVRVADAQATLPSISRTIHAADWHEREAEDLFGVIFEGHPRLGDFVLHNDVWHEGVAPMRKGFDPRRRAFSEAPDLDWKPRRIVEEAGAFAMPVGPVYATASAPVYFQLETVGEEVIRAQPRLFYAYRGIEKLAEDRPASDALVIAERISGTSAFAHSLAVAGALERLCGVEPPVRAVALRILLAELERMRHHVAAIAGICASTGLAVAGAEAAILEEELLRVSCSLSGHRYLFGLNVVGGLARDLDDSACRAAAATIDRVASSLDELNRMLAVSSSFLDRLEEVGVVSTRDAREFGLVGPVARASGLARDLRKAQPYCGYDRTDFAVPRESEGDGYARLRVLFAEAFESARLIRLVCMNLPAGACRVPEIRPRPGAALGWVEAPGGATLHWVRLGQDGTVERYRVVTPSFTNWHGFRLAAERFAFQDFPIILATFALSVHENDR